jgi:hypothetical protein
LCGEIHVTLGLAWCARNVVRQRCACHLGRGERQPRLRPVTRSVQSGYSRPRDRAATRSLSRDRAAWPRDEMRSLSSAEAKQRRP